jgi:DNA-binding NarL/FixJ family response regulator
MPSVPSHEHGSGPRTVIVDADRRVQQSLAEVLRVTGRLTVVGVAGDVRHGLELVEREHPDVVVVDPRLPDVAAGQAFLSGLSLAWPATRVVLTGWSAAGELPSANGQVAAYVSKSSAPDAFVTAVVNACCAAVNDTPAGRAAARSA